jgi:hypothetical protein
MPPLAVPTSAPASKEKPLTFLGSAPYFGALFAIALLAFWPTYLSRLSAVSGYTHVHAVTASMWMLLLVAQPLAIRRRRMAVHRALGRASYVIAPIVAMSMVLLAHSKTHGAAREDLLGAYVPLSLAALFAACYALGIATRRTMALHARFMVSTAMPLIDPVFVRLLNWIYATPPFLYQWITFSLTDAVFVVLIWRERHARTGRAVFPALLAAFVLSQFLVLSGLYQASAWEAFMRWFAALPLTSAP